jgi:16S rRNA (uracil1498-N3)-methyltransferase
MSRPIRTFFFDGPLQGGVFDIRGREARHIQGSLRLKPGDPIALIDGSGRKASAEILDTRDDAVKVRIFDVVEEDAFNGLSLTLAVSVPKERRMDWLVEKCTELGVATIIPTIFRHSVVRPRPGRHGKADKWDRTVREASKQSGRPTLLDVSEFQEFRDVLEIEADLKVLLVPDAAASLAGLVREENPARVLVAVGPEGGTDLAEEKEALDRGFRKARLTTHTLRIETAAVAAAAIVLGLEGC